MILIITVTLEFNTSFARTGSAGQPSHSKRRSTRDTISDGQSSEPAKETVYLELREDVDLRSVVCEFDSEHEVVRLVGLEVNRPVLKVKGVWK